MSSNDKKECDRCGNPRFSLIQTGDRGGGPELCIECYFDP